jgi:hypothetical protein
MAKTLIIHGWSDCSESFKDLKAMLVRNKVAAPNDIYFVDYESREDSLDFNEISRAFHNRLIQRGLITDKGGTIEELNIIVHSTGGLVVRDWIRKYYSKDPAACPVRRIVMLAPASFGSPLAHRGKSFLGSLVKGRWKVGDLLEVGQQILNGLELASPFQWELAHQDLFCSNTPFASNLIQCSVLVGDSDYEGLRGWINKPGTDGTVVICGTHLNATKLAVDYTQNSNGIKFKRPVVHDVSASKIRSGFGVLKGLDHGSIVQEAAIDGQVSALICSALKTATENEFNNLCESLRGITDATFVDAAYDNRIKPPYQQFMFRCLDDTGSPVTDYNLEFFLIKKRHGGAFSTGVLPLDIDEYRDDEEREFSTRLMKIIMAEPHTNTSDQSLRSMVVNGLEMDRLYEDVERRWGDRFIMGGRIHIPETKEGATYDTEELQNVVIFDPANEDQGNFEQLFIPNHTMLVELKVRRYSGYVHVNAFPRSH